MTHEQAQRHLEITDIHVLTYIPAVVNYIWGEVEILPKTSYIISCRVSKYYQITLHPGLITSCFLLNYELD